MRREVAQAQRAAKVRSAVGSWVEAGMIDEAAATAMRDLYADDRVRVSTPLRVLFFFFTAVASLALFGWLLLLAEGFFESVTGLALIGGAGLVALTEVLTGRLRRAESGAEEATALLAVCFLIGAVERMLSGGGGLFDHPTVLASVAALLCGAAAWRWGGVLFGGASAGTLFLAVAGLPAARWIWILVAAMLFLPLLRGAESARWAPGQRRAFAAALAVAVVALYAALHPAGIAVPWLPVLAGSSLANAAEPLPVPAALACAGVVLLPAALLLAGAGWRRRLLLDLGLVLAVLSTVWFSYDAGMGPVWLLLLLAGGAVMAAVMVLRRTLDSGAGHERRGCTAEAALGEGTAPGTIEIAATLASLVPAARAAETPAVSEFRGGGGEFGGGGASSSF